MDAIQQECQQLLKQDQSIAMSMRACDAAGRHLTHAIASKQRPKLNMKQPYLRVMLIVACKLLGKVTNGKLQVAGCNRAVRLARPQLGAHVGIRHCRSKENM